MRKKEILTFGVAFLFVCSMSALVISQEDILQYLIDKGFSISNILVNTMLLSVIILAIIFNLLIVSNKKNLRKQLIINDLLSDIDRINNHIKKTLTNNKKTLEQKIASLNKLIAQKQNIIKELNVKVEEATKERKEKNQEIDDMANGIQHLFYILNNETDLDFNKQEIQNFIVCYKMIDGPFVEKIEKADNGNITLKEELFCILHRLNKSPEEIRLTLNLSKDAYRQLKYRTLKRIKTTAELKSFCDKIQEVSS